jgi:hypothetical protein
VELSEFPKKKRPVPQQEINRPAHGKPRIVRAQSPSGEAA